MYKFGFYDKRTKNLIYELAKRLDMLIIVGDKKFRFIGDVLYKIN